MKRIKKSTKKKSRRRTILDKTKKIIAIFAAMAFDKHFDYDEDDSVDNGNRIEKE